MEKSITKITLNRIDDHMNFEAIGANGKSILMDGSPKIGGQGNGVSPMETLLMAAAGCSSIDVVMILKKMRQTITDYKVEVEAERTPNGEATKYKSIHLHFIVSGAVKEAKLKQAIDMSIEKYCSVTKILACSAEISTSYELGSVVDS